MGKTEKSNKPNGRKIEKTPFWAQISPEWTTFGPENSFPGNRPLVARYLYQAQLSQALGKEQTVLSFTKNQAGKF